MRCFHLFIVFMLAASLWHPAEARKGRDEAKTVRIVFLGDTFSAANRVAEPLTYPIQLRNMLNEMMELMRVEVYNLSRSGQTAANAVSMMPQVLNLKPHVVVVAVGGVDGLHRLPPELTARSIEQILSLLTHNNIYTMVIGFKTPKDNTDLAFAMRYDPMFANLAKKYHLSFIPELTEPIKNDRQLRQFESPFPNAQGHQAIARHIFPYLRKMLDRQMNSANQYYQ